MSYQGLSVKKVINSINSSYNGWFLPAIQRPYVWGSRHENELYICKLFDSILRGYPIGGLIVWNTKETIPFREFVSDYSSGDIPRIVEEGLHSRQDKWLVYDGQQRLQTLYSCLKYTFNDRILIFNLLFKDSEDLDPNDTGYSFVQRNSELPPNFIRLNELFSKLTDEKTTYRKQILKKIENIDDEQEEIIEKNIDQLWKVFVETDKKSLAFFPISDVTENEVNEIFERLNTGGMALTQSDLLLSRIKEYYYDFEEKLQLTSKDIHNRTNKGYFFGPYNILQLLHLLVKGGVRVDPKKIKTKSQSEIDPFNETWKKLEKPLNDFFTDYIWGQYKINNASIVPRKLALLPLIVYFYEIYNKGFQFKHITKENLKKINQYFIKSQINDWNLQTYADNFTTIIRDEAKSNDGLFDFPLDKIIEKINERKQRTIDIIEETFICYTWFALKLLIPQRVYQFEPDISGRFNPEIDHIFPKKLKHREKIDDYDKSVDIIWNMQPTKGDINAYKTNYHPKDFFTNKLESNGKNIVGSKYVNDYDFLLPTNSDKSINFNDRVWDNPLDFINERRKLMIDFLNKNYGIILKEKQLTPTPPDG